MKEANVGDVADRIKTMLTAHSSGGTVKFTDLLSVLRQHSPDFSEKDLRALCEEVSLGHEGNEMIDVIRFVDYIFEGRHRDTVRIGSCMANVTGESGISLEKVMQAVPFQNWVNTVGEEKRLEVSHIHVHSLDMFGPKVGFIKFGVDSKVDGNRVPGTVFMRGGSVAILVILRQADRLFTLLVRQPRVPVCLGNMPELPAGMLDGNGNFGGVAAKEMKEETGIELNESDLIDMTYLAYKSTYPGVLPLCECSDEFNRLFVYQKNVSEEYLASLNGKLAGVESEGEHITLQIIELDKLWRTTPDAKALAALTLYKRLKGIGLIP